MSDPLFTPEDIEALARFLCQCSESIHTDPNTPVIREGRAFRARMPGVLIIPADLEQPLWSVYREYAACALEWIEERRQEAEEKESVA